MSDANRLSKNVILQMLLQISTLVFPLITTPYLSRVLGASGIGAWSYTQSIVYYFVMFSTLGLTTYGTRQISYVRDNRRELQTNFWNIFSLRAIVTGIGFAAYLVFAVFTKSQYKTLFLVQLLSLISNTVDITWLFIGLENFKKTVLRSITVKTIGTVLVFLIIRSGDDVWKYAAIQTGTLVFGNLVLWTFVPKVAQWIRPTRKAMLKHLKPTVLLFLPQISISLYAVFDKTMIGLLTNSVEQVAFYTKAEEFAKIPLSLISAVSTVMLPHMSNLVANNKTGQMRNQFNQNLILISMLSIGASSGIASIAKDFIPWMLGAEFEPSILLMLILSPLTFIICLSNAIGNQLLIPTNRLKIFSVSVTCGAASNFLLNLILIPKYQAVGACIATLAAECIVSMIQLSAAHSVIMAKSYMKSLVRYVLSGLVMFLLLRILGAYLDASITTTVLQIAIGVITYCVLLFAMKDSTMIIVSRSIIAKIRKKHSNSLSKSS